MDKVMSCVPAITSGDRKYNLTCWSNVMHTPKIIEIALQEPCTCRSGKSSKRHYLQGYQSSHSKRTFGILGLLFDTIIEPANGCRHFLVAHFVRFVLIWFWALSSITIICRGLKIYQLTTLFLPIPVTLERQKSKTRTFAIGWCPTNRPIDPS